MTGWTRATDDCWTLGDLVDGSPEASVHREGRGWVAHCYRPATIEVGRYTTRIAAMLAVDNQAPVPYCFDLALALFRGAA